jgi:ATP-binding cassette subfamily B protein
MNADTILVLDDGAIVERGTHEELVANRGLYASLLRRQLLSDHLDDAGEGTDQTAGDLLGAESGTP